MIICMQLKETFESVKRASKTLALLSDEQRNEILLAVADAIINNQERILKANGERENILVDLIEHKDKTPHTEFLPCN